MTETTPNTVASIAILDDDPDFRTYLEDFLNDEGSYAVRAFANPRELFAGCEETLPDIVLLDMKMGEFKGDVVQPASAGAFDPLVDFMVDKPRVNIRIEIQPTETGDAGKALAEARGKAIKALLEAKIKEAGDDAPVDAARIAVAVGEAAADAKAKADQIGRAHV